jgi:hypothetical protein
LLNFLLVGFEEVKLCVEVLAVYLEAVEFVFEVESFLL